jgi:hypothetical protein
MNAADRKQLYEYLKRVVGKGINKVYAHWTAGRYEQVFADYHACIKGNGELYFMTDNLAERLEHTWQRNNKAIGLALCCAYGAKFPLDFSAGYPPTPQQIETVSETTAIICKVLEIPISIKHVMTHAEAADNLDKQSPMPHVSYGPHNGCERWDLWRLPDYDGVWKPGGDVLRGKAIFYQQHL